MFFFFMGEYKFQKNKGYQTTNPILHFRNITLLTKFKYILPFISVFLVEDLEQRSRYFLFLIFLLRLELLSALY